MTRLSLSTKARQRFLGLIGHNPPQQQQQQRQFPEDDDDDVDMLVPNGLHTFFHLLFKIADSQKVRKRTVLEMALILDAVIE